jgi:hypothetical protein
MSFIHCSAFVHLKGTAIRIAISDFPDLCIGAFCAEFNGKKHEFPIRRASFFFTRARSAAKATR